MKYILLLLVILIPFLLGQSWYYSAAVTAAGPTTDDFERASLGANWDVYNTMAITGSSDLYSGSGSENSCAYEGTSFNSNHYSKAEVSAKGVTSYYLGVQVRDDGNGTYYGWYIEPNGTWYSFESNSGSWASKGGGTQSYSVGDTFYMEMDGSNATCKINAITLDTFTDATITGNSPGCGGYKSTTGNTLEWWEGDDL